MGALILRLTTKPKSTQLAPVTPPRRRTRPPVCPVCRQVKIIWPGTTDTACGCTRIAPVGRLVLPMFLPVATPTAKWPGVPEPAA